MKRRNALLAVVVTVVLAGASAIAGRAAEADVSEIDVVVHKGNGVAPMNRAQLASLFKVRSTQFPGDGPATPVNLPADSPFRQEFDRVVLGMSPDEVERFWLDSKIRSGVGAPRKVPGPSSVVRFVGGEESGIGYVPSTDVSAQVRVVARIRGGQVLAP